MRAPWPNCWPSPAPAATTWRSTRTAHRAAAGGTRHAAPADRARRRLLGRNARRTGDLPRRASIHQRYGKAAIENVIISKTDGVSDILEVAVLLKEVGLLRPLEHALDVNIVPLFETIGDLANAGPIMDRLLAIPLYNRLLGSRGRCRNACSAIPTATRTAAS
jgi:hypothetical protein